MTYENDLKDLEKISQAVGRSVDMVQGGGGNTSVKLGDELMAVKASGFKLSQITPSEGYVVVNYKNIKDYYSSVDLNDDRDFEKESVEFVKQNIVPLEGIKPLRPSVEAGFHSIMKKYVIHTHPVYANILCCAGEGKELVDKIFKGRKYEYIWIPYINPGFCLTLKIKEQMENCRIKNGKLPEVIFMENHGLVVTSDDCDECIRLHGEVNDLIKKELDIRDRFPQITLDKLDEETSVSRTGFINDFFRDSGVDEGYFDRIALYPDQLVYLNGKVNINGMGNKLNINTKTGQVTYKTGYSEAMTMEETLLGYLYVIKGIEKSGLAIKTMSEKEKDFINNWESESYRKSLVKELSK